MQRIVDEEKTDSSKAVRSSIGVFRFVEHKEDDKDSNEYTLLSSDIETNRAKDSNLKQGIVGFLTEREIDTKPIEGTIVNVGKKKKRGASNAPTSKLDDFLRDNKVSHGNTVTEVEKVVYREREYEDINVVYDIPNMVAIESNCVSWSVEDDMLMILSKYDRDKTNSGFFKAKQSLELSICLDNNVNYDVIAIGAISFFDEQGLSVQVFCLK